MSRPGLTKELVRSAAAWQGVAMPPLALPDLRRVPGFSGAVTESLTRMVRDGVHAALEAHLAEVAV